MDRSSGIGSVNPTIIAATVKSIITNHQTKPNTAESAAAELASGQTRTLDYTVADLFGRCFLRVCYWVDVFSSMARRGERLDWAPAPHNRAASFPETQPAQELISGNAGIAVGSPPVADA